MPEVDRHLNGFVSWCDAHAVPKGTMAGEFGIITRMMQNTQDGTLYYLNYVREWYHKFPQIIDINNEPIYDRIPKEDRYSEGISVGIDQLNRAQTTNNTFIVIVHPDLEIEGNDVTFFGCNVIDWVRYVKAYNVVFKKRSIDKITQGGIPLRLLWDMRGFKYT